MKKKIILKIFAIFLVLAVSFSSGCKLGGKDVAKGSSVFPLTTTVTRVSIQEQVTVSGNIGPVRSRNLGFSSTGKITAIDVSEGMKVSKGTILARIDTSSDEYAIEAKQYELEQSRYNEPPRKIKLIEKELNSLKKILENKVITAPFDGTIAKINQREGEISSGTAEGYFIYFIDRTKLKAKVVVDELDISRITIGQKVIFSFDAIPGEFFFGEVSKIANIGRISSRGLPVIDIETVITDPDPRIYIPFSFKAEILVEAPAEYIVMDERAVVWKDDEVFANLLDPLDPKRTILRSIRIKPWKDGKVIILGGLKEGDETVLQDKVSEDNDEGFLDMGI